MQLSPMKYGDYTWPHNPKIYEIEYKRRIVCHKVPFGLYALSDMGRDQRILRGEGEFVGEGAYDEFKKLASAFYSSKPKILVHPIWQSAPAWFVGLTLKQEPRADYVSYEFEFWECFEGYDTSLKEVVVSEAEVQQAETPAARKSHTICRGDTLWGLAMKNGLSLSQLLALNPQIRNPNIYYCGDVVYLS
ncbi:MAG: LysM peptidoglycan-binding domain-containing protein [Oscillospiraceae bacterium]